MSYELRSARWIAADVLRQVVQPGDTVVDATLGNGHDTLMLCELVGETGRVIGFDIQPDAVERTRERLADDGQAVLGLLQLQHGLLKRAQARPLPVQELFGLRLTGAVHAVRGQELRCSCAHRLSIDARCAAQNIDRGGSLADDGIADERALQKLRLRVEYPQRRADAPAKLLMDGHAAFLYNERIRAVFKQRGQNFRVHFGRISFGNSFSIRIMTSDSSSASTITPTAIR